MSDTDAVKEALDNLCSEAHYNGNTLTLVKSWRDTVEAAIASRPAEVDDEGLPPLPDPWHGFQFNSGWHSWEQVSHWAVGDADVTRAYTEEQFRDGQRDAVAADRARREKLPANAAEMIAFIGSHYHFMRDMPDPNDTVYELTVHDLLSAFRWWFDDYDLEDEPSHTTNKEK